MSGRHEKPIPVVMGTEGGEVMIFGDDSGNLGSRMTVEILEDLKRVDGLTEEQIGSLARISSSAAIRALRETLDGPTLLRLDVHRDDDRPVEVFTVERTTHEAAVTRMRGEQ